MAQPAPAVASKGNRILFFVRNPNSVTTIINFLNARSMKSWIATGLEEAQTKIKNNNIQVVFISVGIKNASIVLLAESIKTHFNTPIVIFSEEDSRKAEGEVIRIPNFEKLLPPNQNAKFSKAIEKAVGNSQLSVEGGGKSAVEELVPTGAETIVGLEVPPGRWLKMNSDEKAPPPFTYKLIQPRSQILGKSRYFYVGDKIPDLKEGKWNGVGTFHVIGRIVEKPIDLSERSEPDSDPQESESSEVVSPKEDLPYNFESEPSQLQNLPQVIENSDWNLPKAQTPSQSWGFTSRLKSYRSDLNSKTSGLFSGFSNSFGRMSSTFSSVKGSFFSAKGTLQGFLRRAFQSGSISLIRKAQNLVEDAIEKSVIEAVEKPLPEKSFPQEMTSHVGIVVMESTVASGYILADLRQGADEDLETLNRLMRGVARRLSKSAGMNLIVHPTVVTVEPFKLVELLAQQGHFLVHAESPTRRILCGFMKVEKLPRLRSFPDHDKLQIAAETLSSQMRLMFNLYVHLPKNEKHVQYYRFGQTAKAGAIEKFKASPTTELLIEPTAVATYYAYLAVDQLLHRDVSDADVA